MSWSIQPIGPRAAVRAIVIANQTCPENLKAAIVELIDEPGNGNGSVVPPVPHDSARVHGYGHTGGGYGGIGKLEVELFTAAKLPEGITAAK